MDTLDRYLVKEFLSYFVLVLIGLASLYLGIDFLSKFWNMNTPAARALELYLYKLPSALQLFFPVACLMATLFVLTTMSRQNEVLALYTSGIGNLRILSTFVTLVAILSMISFLIFDTFIPTFSKRHLLLSRGMDPNAEYAPSEAKLGMWYRSGRLIYNIGRFNPGDNSLEDVKAYLLTPTFEMREALRAKQGRFVDNEWELIDGYVVQYPGDPPFPVAHAFSVRRGMIPEKPSDLKTIKIEDQTMRLRDLRHYIARNKSYGLDTTVEQVNYHERLALVFAPLVFVLLGVSFAIRPLKTHSIARSMGYCFLMVFIYLLMFRMTLSVGKGGHIPPVAAAWSTNVIFLFLSLFFTMKR